MLSLGELMPNDEEIGLLLQDGWVDARGVMMDDASQRMIGIGIDITDDMQTQGTTSHSASDLYC
jgi:hypothetical protein